VHRCTTCTVPVHRCSAEEHATREMAGRAMSKSDVEEAWMGDCLL